MTFFLLRCIGKTQRSKSSAYKQFSVKDLSLIIKPQDVIVLWVSESRTLIRLKLLALYITMCVVFLNISLSYHHQHHLIVTRITIIGNVYDNKSYVEVRECNSSDGRVEVELFMNPGMLFKR